MRDLLYVTVYWFNTQKYRIEDYLVIKIQTLEIIFVESVNFFMFSEVWLQDLGVKQRLKNKRQLWWQSRQK